MPPGWFGPPHAMHPQQGAHHGGSRFHPGPGQRGPPPQGMSGGVNSPHTHSYHQRSSPPMRGPYPGHGHAGAPRHHAPPPHGHPPHGARMPQGGRFQMQHPPGVVVGGPRPMPPSAAGHNPMARHHASSPAMPPRMQMPPHNVMRPIPQPLGPVGSRPPSYEHPSHRAPGMHQHGAPRGMQQHQPHMMRMEEEHSQLHQLPPPAPHHHHHHLPLGNAADHPVERQPSEDSHAENRMQQSHHFPSQHTPGTPEERNTKDHGTSSRSPSPPPIPPPPQYQGQEKMPSNGGDPQRSSPGSSPGGEGCSEKNDSYHSRHRPPPPLSSKPPSWNQGPGMGPLRESRLQNMPQDRVMVPMQQQFHFHHYPHPQRPIPQHMSHNAYVNENMERFRAMELNQHHGMKPIHRQGPPPPHHQPPRMYHPNVRSMVPSPGGQHPMAMPMHQQPPPPPMQQKGDGKSKKKGPDITMDAASMLLALRTSASPSTVSAATLEEQASRDQSEVSKSDQQEHDYLEDDDVPALQSSSSSLSVPHTKPTVQHHEVPKNFPTRLALPNDEAKLNSLHCFLRSELLEIFVVEKSNNKSPTHSPGSSVGRVGLRCVFCAMVRKRHSISTTAEHDLSGNTQHPRCDEAPMAVFYPKSIAEIYRLVTSWQRCHLRKCRNLPPQIRNKWTMLRENDKSRGKTHYWITSAKEIGLVDCNSRAGGIRFATTNSSSAIGGADNDSVCEGPSYKQRREHEGFQNSSQAYQPRNNQNFTEGPSQRQREAVSRDVDSSVPAIDSPMKQENKKAEPTQMETSEDKLSGDALPSPARNDKDSKHTETSEKSGKGNDMAIGWPAMNEDEPEQMETTEKPSGDTDIANVAPSKDGDFSNVDMAIVAPGKDGDETSGKGSDMDIALQIRAKNEDSTSSAHTGNVNSALAENAPLSVTV